MIPNPWIILGVIIFVIGTYFYGHHSGWEERDLEMQAEIAKKNEEAREVERNMTDKVNQTAVKLQEANSEITQKQSALDRAIRAGRLRVNTASCLQTSANSSAATGNRDQAGSEPNRQADSVADAERATLAAIAEIIAQGDRNTAQLNACIDAYNTLRENMNGQR